MSLPKSHMLRGNKSKANQSILIKSWVKFSRQFIIETKRLSLTLLRHVTHGNKAPKHTQKYTCYDTCLSKLMNSTQEVVTLTWGDTTDTPPLVDGVAMDTRRRGRWHTPGFIRHNVIFQKLIVSLTNRFILSCIYRFWLVLFPDFPIKTNKRYLVEIYFFSVWSVRFKH